MSPIRQFVRPFMRLWHCACGMLFPRYLLYASMDFHQTVVSSAFWDENELIRFRGQKVKGQGPSITKGPACVEF